MNDLTSAVATFACVAFILAATHIPLGTYIAHVFTTEHHLGIERLCYRIVGVDPTSQQRWTTYTTALLSFSAVSILALWGLILAQDTLPFADGRHQSIDGALNTAISFVTNTNWQSYSGENGATHLVQMLGLTVQNFLSAAVGLTVAIALIRGLTRHDTDRIGNFWVDLTRSIFRILLPLTAIAALLLLTGGVIQNLTEPHTITTITGTQQTLPAGPVASQEAIKL
ncbi:potassium-transporting ATPase subunit KdpA, partial [Dermatophilus congolensis]